MLCVYQSKHDVGTRTASQLLQYVTTASCFHAFSAILHILKMKMFLFLVCVCVCVLLCRYEENLFDPRTFENTSELDEIRAGYKVRASSSSEDNSVVSFQALPTLCEIIDV